MRFSKSSVGALAITLPLALAQTSTTCKPTEKTCPNNPGLNSGSYSADFTSGKSALADWTSAEGTTLNFGSNGAEFSISAAGQAPTISSNFYIFFGTVSVKMRAAPGAGIVSSIVLLSDDLDEIDWEFLGGNSTTVETNFFGKGNTTSYDRAIYYDVTDPQDDVHTYTVDWNSDRIEWIIDGQVVRTVPYTSSLALGGKNYPQTPMQLRLGNWCGGCSGEPEGTVQWAGGPTTFNDAPYNMYVESVTIQNANPADAYEYVGESGSWQSIKIIKNGTTTSASGSNSTSSMAGNSTGHHSKTTGGVKTHTAITTASYLPSGASPTANGAVSSGPASASSTGTSSNSATSLAMWTSSSLLGLLFGFMLL